jgi:hypothetical protein
MNKKCRKEISSESGLSDEIVTSPTSDPREDTHPSIHVCGLEDPEQRL